MEKCKVRTGLHISVLIFIASFLFVMWLEKEAHIDKSDTAIGIAIGAIPLLIFGALTVYVLDFAPQ